MARPRPPKTASKEARLQLAEQAIKLGQFKSIRRAAKVFNVPRTTLQDQLNGLVPKRGYRAPNNLLLEVEEIELINWILEIERRGFLAYIIDVERLATELISRRGSSTPLPLISKN
jgi:helix-turn-helix, Psq domain